MRHSVTCFLVGLAALWTSNPLQAATVTSPRVDVALHAIILTSITVAVANPAIEFGVVTPGNTKPAPAQAQSVVTTWNLNAGVTLKLYAYFDSAANAMTGTLSGDMIPVSAFTATVNGGSPQGFTATSPFTAAATALPLYSVPISSVNAVATRTDALSLTMNLTGLTPQADTYLGTMHLQAQAL